MAYIMTIDPGINHLAGVLCHFNEETNVLLPVDYVSVVLKEDDKFREARKDSALNMIGKVMSDERLLILAERADRVHIETPHEKFCAHLNQVSAACAALIGPQKCEFLSTCWTNFVKKDERIVQIQAYHPETLELISKEKKSKVRWKDLADCIGMALYISGIYKFTRPKRGDH